MPILRLCAAILLCVTGASARTIELHPAPDALNNLQDQLAADPDVREVVMHAGIYRGSLRIAGVEGAKPLLVRPAGDGEVVIDGSQPIIEADNPQPVEGYPGVGVYRVDEPVRFRTHSHAAQGVFPQMWDRKTRKRYTLVADERTVMRAPGSFAFTGDALYVHTDDGKPLAEHQLEISMLDGAGNHGVMVHRTNTTVRGLHARSFFTDTTYTGAFAALAPSVTFEDCTASNVPRGYMLMHAGAVVRRCRAFDVGSGARTAAPRFLFEDCTFTKVRDDFTVPIPDGAQEDSGVVIYFNTAESATLRGNHIAGFTSGAYIKCLDGEYLFENNLIENTRQSGIDGVNHRRPNNTIIARGNAFVNVSTPLRLPAEAGATLIAQNNTFWADPSHEPLALDENVQAVAAYGEGNRIANPRDTENDVTPPTVDLDRQPAMSAFEGRYLTAAAHAPVHIAAYDDVGVVARMKFKVGDADWSQPLPPVAVYPVKLAKPGDTQTLSVAARDAAGNWSSPQTIMVERIAERVSLVGDPTIRVNRYGAVLSFTTDAPCIASGSWGPDDQPMRTRHYVNNFDRYHYYENIEPRAALHHVLAIVHETQRDGETFDYRIELTGENGVHQGATGSITFAGEPRKWFVSEAGIDAESRGGENAPWRTLQYAVDRALPGDAITVADGVYTKPVIMTHGGAPGAPITLRAANPWGAVIDGMGHVRHPIATLRAPHVTIEGFELRWFTGVGGIYAFRSGHVTIRGCKIWNAFWWKKRQSGRAIFAMYCPHLTVARNLMFKTDMTLLAYQSPYTRVVHNTATGTSHGGLMFEGSPHSVIRYNDLAFQGNDVLSIRVDHIDDLATYDCDYNNLGTYLRGYGARPSVHPNCDNPNTPSRSKAVVFFVDHRGTWTDGVGGYPKAKFMLNSETPAEKRGDRYLRFRVIDDWQAFSGLDKHSLFADPKRVNMPQLQFALMPNSPLIGAGPNGETIGAMDVWQDGAASREPVSGALVDAWFINDAEDFKFVDDAKQPKYADGSWIKQGASGGALRTVVGGVDRETVKDIAAGWRQSFDVVAGDVPLRGQVRAMLVQTMGYEDDEISELRILLDGRPIDATLVKISGGHGSTGWMTFDFALDALEPGMHELAILVHNNQKTSDNEITELVIDRVLIAPAR